MQLAGVLLDVDGTLVASNDAHAHAWVEVLARHGHDVAFARVRRLIGMGGDRLVEEITGLPRDSKHNRQIGGERSQVFRERWLRAVRPLPGSRALLLRLRADGLRYALASAAKSDELQPLLEPADIADLVDDAARTTSSDVDESKPSPDIVEAALAKLAVECGRALLIGDTPYDVRAARDAGVRMIGVTSGGGPPTRSPARSRCSAGRRSWPPARRAGASAQFVPHAAPPPPWACAGAAAESCLPQPGRPGLALQ
jgi:HAD superfamily hydrolase (TIGR01509 family)